MFFAHSKYCFAAWFFGKLAWEIIHHDNHMGFGIAIWNNTENHDLFEKIKSIMDLIEIVLTKKEKNYTIDPR